MFVAVVWIQRGELRPLDLGIRPNVNRIGRHVSQTIFGPLGSRRARLAIEA
jgi:hypothetical protein